MNTNWFVIGASVAGRGHTNGLCQDANYYRQLSNGWGVAVVCDGAGSAVHSDLGAQFVSKQIGRSLAVLSEKYGQKLPTAPTWKKDSRQVFRQTYDLLKQYAEEEGKPFASFACTVIAILYCDQGIAVAHIGDGRAGYCDEDGWKGLFTPHKGEEANETLFLTSALTWKTSETEITSDVFRCVLRGFVLISDGLESGTFEMDQDHPETGKRCDPNRPFKGFFEPLIDMLLNTWKDLLPEERDARWRRFLEVGTLAFQKATDDKTMIFGANRNAV